MLFSEDCQTDVITILTFVASTYAQFGLKAGVNQASIRGCVYGMRQDFPHEGGFVKASPYQANGKFRL